ncbi:hypothetical protein ACMHYB_45425 [Sorangium sp. So ce1128]
MTVSSVCHHLDHRRNVRAGTCVAGTCVAGHLVVRWICAIALATTTAPR